MKSSELWLREWINPKQSREELSALLTMGGLEVEELLPVAGEFKNVVVGEVLELEKHPEADRLKICKVNIGNKVTLQIVCGAPNVKVGLKVPVALINASLPNGLIIQASKIRGVDSAGMLCSAKELGISDNSEGLFELPHNAPIGENLRQYLQLDDYTIDVSITPNRGDCLSVRGLARELSALTNTPLNKTLNRDTIPIYKHVFPVKVTDKAGCARYVGRVIKNVNANVVTPLWLQERLRRSGVRRISAIVDVTNYVMLELGQPMHAFDLNKIDQEINIRQSIRGEHITLLDGSEQKLDDATLVIADKSNPLAIAGVMGGIDSSVTLTTTDVFLESAYFDPKQITKQRQFYKLQSDSAYRFERGVDHTIQHEAMEYATQLILKMCGGEAGAVIEELSENNLPVTQLINLPHIAVKQVLGLEIAEQTIQQIFSSLQFKHSFEQGIWSVEVPAYRSDITLPEDLIEEIARINGYDKIPTHNLYGKLQTNQISSADLDLFSLRQCLCDLAYHEVITYSFIEKIQQKLLDGEHKPREVLNPISAEMAVMRTSLWPGLINTLIYNQSRQQHRIRLFEIGTCFLKLDNKIHEIPKLAGLITGAANREQWGVPTREADFYDLKGDIQHFLSSILPISGLEFKPGNHVALHPGQCADLYLEAKRVGVLGLIHPSLQQSLNVSNRVYLFEIDLNLIRCHSQSQAQEISKFPEIRRDIAILVNQAVPAQAIQDTIKVIAGDWLKDVFIFDVYEGKGISPGLKSIALALILQHPSRTLVDDEVMSLMEKVTTTLQGKLGAELRS